MNKKLLIKKGLIIVMILMMTSQSIIFANEAFVDVSKTHWIRPTLDLFLSEDLISADKTFNLGRAITQKDIFDILVKIKPESSVNATQVDSKNSLTRIQALRYIFDVLELSVLNTQVKDLKPPFTDISTDSVILSLSVRFGWIGMGSNQQFRPNDLMKKEELYSILGKIYQQLEQPLDVLHGYYAISSYSQLNLASNLDSLSFGWGRLELDETNQTLYVNTTSSNGNEYYIPSGSQTVMDKINQNKSTKQLMIFVKDQSLFDDQLGKTVSLAEYILNHPEVADQAMNAMLSTLDKSTLYDGLLLDFEGLKGLTNAKKYNEFIVKIKKSLDDRDMTLSVAVHPVRKTGLDYYDGYDYKTIGEHADYVILMAHDYYAKKLTQTEMNSGYTVTPLSPLNEVYYALSAITNSTTGVQDKSKILLQFSFDSVQWKLKEGKIINALPYHPSYTSISSRIDSGVVPKYSVALQSPYLEFYDAKDGTQNVVWYENEKSIQSKIDLAKMFGIGGISAWRLGTIPNIETDLNKDMLIWDQIISNMDAKASEQ